MDVRYQRRWTGHCRRKGAGPCSPAICLLDRAAWIPVSGAVNADYLPRPALLGRRSRRFWRGLGRVSVDDVDGGSRLDGRDQAVGQEHVGAFLRHVHTRPVNHPMSPPHATGRTG